MLRAIKTLRNIINEKVHEGIRNPDSFFNQQVKTRADYADGKVKNLDVLLDVLSSCEASALESEFSGVNLSAELQDFNDWTYVSPYGAATWVNPMEVELLVKKFTAMWVGTGAVDRTLKKTLTK